MANYAIGSIGYDTTFELNEFNEPKLRSEMETLKNVLLFVLFTKPGQYPSLPTVGLNIGSSLYEFYDEIERYEVNLGRSKHNAISVGLIAFGDVLTITISSKLCENTTERDVLRKLSEFGIDIKVESNRRDRYGK